AGKLQQDDTIVLAAFGAGFVWGAGLVRWGVCVTDEASTTTGSLTNV
ncbi:MAG: 3-oxoacyl-[acyl-carrier-protein] synthase III C-terminal domain-containing protein, partial [Actinomycetota bacterium]